MKTNTAQTGYEAKPLGNGRYHVPCIRAESNESGIAWWPIVGQWHEDGEIIGFPIWHFHIDWRFADETELKMAQNTSRQPLAEVITAGMIRPVGEYGRDDDTAENPTEKDPTATLPNARRTMWLRYEVRQMRRQATVMWPATTWWFPKLEAKFANARLGGTNGWVCPHRAVDLESMVLPEATTVQCPLHGLRWCTKTRRLAPQTTSDKRKE